MTNAAPAMTSTGEMASESERSASASESPITTSPGVPEFTGGVRLPARQHGWVNIR